MSMRATMYGSTFAAGLRSSKYPFPSNDTPKGIRMDAPLSATPDLNVLMFAVSCSPATDPPKNKNAKSINKEPRAVYNHVHFTKYPPKYHPAIT
jgi:hypothetical protein